MTLPDDWASLLDAGRRAGWELAYQSRYGAAPRVYAWRCARTVGGGWFATGEGEMELGTVEMARGWLAEGCPAPVTPIELWSMRRAA